MQSKPLNIAALLNHAGLPLFLMAALLLVYFPSDGQDYLECSLFPALSDQKLNWFTGHFCHSSKLHWLLNALGFGIFALLYGRSFNAIGLCLLVFCLMLGTNVYLYGLYSLDFYLGLSSILYGLFLFAALQQLPAQRFTSLLVILALATQFTASALALYSTPADLPAAAGVHLASASCSAVLYLVWLTWRNWRRKNCSAPALISNPKNRKSKLPPEPE